MTRCTVCLDEYATVTQCLERLCPFCCREQSGSQDQMHNTCLEAWTDYYHEQALNQLIDQEREQNY